MLGPLLLQHNLAYTDLYTSSVSLRVLSSTHIKKKPHYPDAGSKKMIFFLYTPTGKGNKLGFLKLLFVSFLIS